jgi:anti-sigma factor ChrR (cupin superfamily)
MSVLISCEATHVRLSDYEDGCLSLWDTFKVWLHLLFCPQCRAVLATLRTLPRLVEGMAEAPAPPEAEAALAAAMARFGAPPEPRPWPSSPVPAEALVLLVGQPDQALSILAEAHQSVARARVPAPGPYHLPQAVLDRLPPEDQWRWTEGANGRRRAELLRDPAGSKLLLAYAPTGARTKAHRHLGSESILILAGTMLDSGLALTQGHWVHHPYGSVHAPEIRDEACWCLIREEGSSVAAGPFERLRLKVAG